MPPVARALCLLAVLASCRPLTLGRSATAAPKSQDRIVAVLVNGGGRKEINFQSHLQHIRSVVGLLRDNGVAAEDIVIFSGDGPDPELDLATRAVNPLEELWLLPHSGLGRALRPRVEYVDSQLDGFELRPARIEPLRQWFETEGARLGAGDALLFYVTDHGERNKNDLGENTITLWGEKLSVSELRELFRLVPAETRVVMLMSQCFSGAFANAIYAAAGDATPRPNVCGYFSSTAERPAYGCYPENLGKDGVGHSFHLLEATEDLGTLSEAHLRTLVTDNSPDVPHTTADFYLDRLLERYAAAQELETTAVADELIATAWKHKGDWEPEIRLLDRIGQTFGFFSPRSLAELERQADALPAVSRQLRTYAERWQEALDALAEENLKRFLDRHPKWRERLKPSTLAALGAEARAQLAAELIAELSPFTENDAATHTRLLLLRRRAEDAHQAAYRMEVRLGVVLRMRAILQSIAGREYLELHGTPLERDTYARLRACEDLWVDPSPRVDSAAALPAPEQFPALTSDRALVNTVMPAWMGIRYRPLEEVEHETEGTATGAVAVITVYPESPAESAGLHVGDIILGASGSRFAEPNQVREWTMRSEIGEQYPLEVLRDRKLMRLTLRPAPFPIEMPELPGPPEVGSAAPAVKVELVRGSSDLRVDRNRLLFFWATWCLPCKASVPELMAFAEDRDVEIVAITDEPGEVVEKFLAEFKEPFPEVVATDRFRITFQNFGVSGTPTFVLLDASGKVKHYKTGYAPKLGLGIDGWTWKPKKRAGLGSDRGIERSRDQG
jgi:thiol-disulfide isomerase/thioredoxin